MRKQLYTIQREIGENSYMFLCEVYSPLSEVKEALTEMLGEAIAIEIAAKKQQEAQETPSCDSQQCDSCPNEG